MIEATPFIKIDEGELHFDFIRAAGPGGQNVNKVASAVQLRFDILNSASLEPEVKERLTKIAGSRVTGDGILILSAKRYRSQEQNREDAVQRLIALIQKAAQKPKPRHRTKPSKAAQEARLAEKKRRSVVKRLRGTTPRNEE